MTRRRSTAALAGALVSLILAAALPAASAAAAAVELQGHRGARGLWPENTLPAFRAAIALGVDTLELDTVVTRDGVVVVSHEPRLVPDLARGPDGRWVAPPGPLLHDLDYAEIRRYDVGRPQPGSRTAKRFPQQQAVDGTRVPTLAAVLALGRAHPKLRFNVETKLDPEHPDQTPAAEPFAKAVLQVVREAGMLDRVSIQSFDWRTLRVVQRLAPGVPTVCLSAQQRWLDNLLAGRPGPSPWTAGLDIDDVDGSPPRLVKAAGCAVWSPYYRDLSEARLAEAHALGLTVVVWTVDSGDDIRRMAEMGVDGIISDYPDRARGILDLVRD